MRTRLLHAWFGVLATLVGLGLAHLAAALTTPAASPVLAVGSTVIDLTPTPVKEWAVSTFGTADKPILIGSVVVVVLLLAALAGVVAARSLTAGVCLLLALTLLAALAALTRPTAYAADVVPSVVAALAGTATLTWLVRLAERRRQAPDTRPAPVAADGAETLDSGPASGPTTDGGATRRGVLAASGGLAVLAVASGAIGRFITERRVAGTSVTIPEAASTLGPLPAGLEERVPGITPFRTPTEDFYRIDTRLSLPVVDADSWTLTIDGDVDREVTFTFADIAAMELIERDITLTCVSNPVGGEYVGGARWTGVPLQRLLDEAGIGSTQADQILSTDVDGMTISTPLALATDGRDAMLAIGMNGGPLPQVNGFPARLVIPGLYGFISATKWVTRLTLTTYAEQEAYWTERKWVTDAPIKLSSRVDVPKAFDELEAGRQMVGGIAWAQDVGVEKVEVSIDGGAWTAAELGPSAGDDYWRQWAFEWDAQPGPHFVSCRVTDKAGTVQESARMQPFPEGASGLHEIRVTVA